MTSPEKILIVGNFLSVTKGIRFVCEDLAERLTAAGWAVVSTSRKKSRLLRLLDMISTIYRRKNDYKLALVDVYSGLSFVWAEAACCSLRSLGKPFVLALHGGNLPAFARQWPGRVRRLLQGAVKVTSPSRYLIENLSGYAKPIQHLPNPLDLPRYPFRLRSQPRPRISWLRALRHIYNPTLAVRTLGLLGEDIPDIHLDIIGPDQKDGVRERLLRTADSLGVRDKLRLVGGVPKLEVPSWLEQGDIFLNTTNIDNMPVSVLEAMACGLCVVSTKVGGIPYLLEHEKDALLVPPDDPEAMATAVRRILTEPGLAARLSQNARRKAEQFDWSIILPQWEALLTEVAEGQA